MSKDDAPARAASPQYLDWLRRERRTRVAIRVAQLAILIAILVLWEVLPRLQILNPLFTSYPSAIWPTFLRICHFEAPKVCASFTLFGSMP